MQRGFEYRRILDAAAAPPAADMQGNWAPLLAGYPTGLGFRGGANKRLTGRRRDRATRMPPLHRGNCRRRPALAKPAWRLQRMHGRFADRAGRAKVFGERPGIFPPFGYLMCPRLQGRASDPWDGIGCFFSGRAF